MTTWAKGLDFKNSDNTRRIGGVGVYGTDNKTDKIYIGLGSEPWNNSGLEVTDSDITFKGKKIYREGDSFSANDIGALPLSGGTLTGALKLKGTTMTSTINCNRITGREELQIYAAGDAYSEGSKGSGIHLYGNNDAEHTGNIAFLTGDNNAGTARMIISQKGNVTIGHAIWDFVDTNKDIGLLNIKGVSGKTALYFNTVNKADGEIGVPVGENLTMGHVDTSTNTFTADFELTSAGNAYVSRGELYVKDNKVYHTGNKPTPSDIGAATSSHTHSYLPLTGGSLTGNLTVSGDVKSTSMGIGSPFDTLPNTLSLDNVTNIKTTGLEGSPGQFHIIRSFGHKDSPNCNMQMAWYYGATTKLKYRIQNGNTNEWSDWGVLYSDTNKPKAADIGALPLTGGTLTGELRMSGKAIRLLDDTNAYPRIGVEADTSDVFISNMNNNWLRLKADKTMTYAGYKVYTSYEKPTPADIGAAASSHTHNYAGSSSAGGAATSAVTLATARTINGTSFNGSANITTANWGTARTLTIGSTGKSVNGSANVSWSLSEIGAAAASHTHSYLPLSGGTLTGNLTMSGSTNKSITISSTRKAYINLIADTDNADETDTAYVKFLQDGSAIGGFVGLVGNAGTNPEGGSYTGTEANALSLISTSDVNIGAYSKTVMKFNNGSSTSLNDMIFKDTYTVTGVEPYRGVGHSRVAQGDTAGSLRIELFNTSGTTVARNYLFSVGTFYPNGSPMLGYSTYRWGQIYSTAGTISTSDSRLKENIEPVKRTEVNLMDDTDQPTSYDFYNYIKKSSAYTFNYKKEFSQDTQPWLGILADEIPDNVFSKIGMMSKTIEEHETEIKEQQEAKELLKKIQIPLSIENDEKQLKVFGDTIVEGTELTYRELKEKAERRIEEPIRMINSSAQIAMLQEVLSMALNKIESLENTLKEKGLC